MIIQGCVFIQLLQGVFIEIIQGVLMIIQWCVFIQLLQGVLYWNYTGCPYYDYTVVFVYSAITGCPLFRLYRMFL